MVNNLINLIFNNFSAVNLYRLENEERLIKEKENENNLKGINDLSNSVIELNQKNEMQAGETNGGIKLKKIVSLNENLVRIEIENDKRILRWHKIKYLIVSYIIMVSCSFIKGSEYYKSIFGIKE